MRFYHKAAVKIFIAASVAGVFFVAVFLLHKEKPEFTCDRNAKELKEYDEKKSGNFSCYSVYYGKFVEMFGVSAAFEDIKTRVLTDPYAKRECHLMTHVIGRKAAAPLSSLSDAFAGGDAFCGGGYFHGVTEGIIQQGGHKLTPEFLSNLCAPFRNGGNEESSMNHLDCAHGIGHAIMYANNNELFDSLKICDLLADGFEPYPCWMGAFMENGIADTEDHSTKYLKTDDLMYPCNAVEEKYKRACYAFQTSYVLRTTGSFEKMLIACREAPEDYQNICFESVGRDVAGGADMDVARTKDGCLALSPIKNERESCVRAAVKVLLHHYRSENEGRDFCASLPEDLKNPCFETEEAYAYRFLAH